MGIPNRPQLFWQVSFNADPNDTTAIPLWTDLTATVRKVTQNKRGQQYELAQTVAATPTITFRDPNEYLNPANTSSPYAPDVQPYRHILGQALWPNPPAAGVVNLLNSGRWKPNNEAASDPSFESYANGAAMPNWLTALGAVVPTVTTTNPQQGTKSLTYAAAAVAARQGVAWRADCVPGQQYTASAYVRQSSASTQWLLVGGQSLVVDEFDRSASNGWGTADFSTGSGTYTNTNGSASDYSVTPGVAKHSVGTLNVRRFTTVGSTFVDTDQVITITVPPTITSASGADELFMGLVCRFTDASNYYLAEVGFASEPNLMTLNIRKRVAAVTTVLTSISKEMPRVPGSQFFVRFQVTGNDLRVRMWPVEWLEPVQWDIGGDVTPLTDGAIATAGAVGATTFASSAITNALPVVTEFSGYRVTGSTGSTTTTTTGSYVRLTQTFTATQPAHTVTVATRGTGVAGTVNVDALQHEAGASASSFTASGPVIYPILADYGERWTRIWGSSGFEGFAPVPAVDAFAALNAITIATDYVAALADTHPDFYWSLGGGTETGASLESSGNNGPPLTQLESKFGAGSPVSFGSSMGIPGDAGAGGARFTVIAPATNQGTILAAGVGASGPPLLVPPVVSTTGAAYIAASAACWVLLNGSPADTGTFMDVFTATLPSAQVFTPIFIGHNVSFGAYQARAIMANGATVVQTAGGGPLNDGLPHLVGAVAYWPYAGGGGTMELSLYVDGVLVGSNSGVIPYPGVPADTLTVGGFSHAGSFSTPFDGSISGATLWNRRVSAAEFAALYAAGAGHIGETTGERLTRHLGSGRYTGTSRISTGLSTLGAPSWSGGIDLLADGQSLAQAEQGRFWVAPDGAVVFEDREDRWLRLTSIATLGENVAGGETPYLDGITFDYDPTFVYATVRISRNNGSQAFGGTAGDVAIATRKYFGRSFAFGADFEFDQQAQDAADFIFNTHKAPVQRVSSVTIDPGANTALWPLALSLEIGQRITVRRRAKAGNGGAGLTMDADYFIESVAFGDLDMDTMSWKMTFQLSPLGGVDEGNGISFQPWILENTTYGVLDSTTILGW